MSAKINKPAKFLSALIHRSYLPEELPPAITARYFAEFCATHYAFLKAQQPALAKRATEFETFTAPRTKSGRRNLALVHPIAQTNLSLLITEHRSKIKRLITRSATSLYDTTEDLKNLVAFSGLDFRKRSSLQAKAYSECSVVLNADISRFFYTVYTHSIPWAVVGKEKAKKWLSASRSKLDGHWSSKIDRALQLCQSRETFGIPVGPDTSRIIAEILLSGIETDEGLAPLLKGRFCFRLVDDFTIGFDRVEDAAATLAALRHALWKFNLQLNEEKTTILSSRSLMRSRWELEHEAFEISDENVQLQASQIARLIELTFHLCSSSQIDTPALWTCRRISQLKNIRENFGLILDGLFRLARDFPRCMNYVAMVVINNQDFCRSPAIKARIRRWCRATIRTHLDHGHDFEVAWSLVVCGVLKLKIAKEDLSAKELPRPTILALLGLLQEKGLLSFSLSNWPWRAELKRRGVWGPYWLPFYEAVRRRWTTDKAFIGHVSSDPVLSKMLAAKVTFLDDRIFDAAQIRLPKRISASGGARIRTKSGIARFRQLPKSKKKVRGFGDIIRIKDMDY